MYANGDTTSLELSWGNGDTTNAELLGIPKTLAMCPGGDLIVGTYGLFAFRFQWIDNHYVVVDLQSTFDYYKLICLDDQHYVSIGQNSLKLWGKHYLETSFQIDEKYFWDVIWRDPMLVVRASNLDNPDTIYFLKSNLDLSTRKPLKFQKSIQWRFIMKLPIKWEEGISMMTAVYY